MGCPFSTEDPACIPTGLPEDDQDYYAKANGTPPAITRSVDSADGPVISVTDENENKKHEESEDDDIDRHFIVHGGLTTDNKYKFGIDGKSEPDSVSHPGKTMETQQSSKQDTLKNDRPPTPSYQVKKEVVAVVSVSQPSEDDISSSERKTSEISSSESQPLESQYPERRSSENQSSERQSSDSRSLDSRSPDSRSPDSRSPDSRSPDSPESPKTQLSSGSMSPGSMSPESLPHSSLSSFSKASTLGDSRSQISTSSSLQRKMKSGSTLSKGSSTSMMSLYSQAGEENYGKYVITGDINFGLHYNYKTNIFEVKIKACRDLAPVDVKKIKSDPYVKTYLLPDKTKASKRKTSVRKGTINPQFEVSLRYPISQSELETRTLSVTVWNNDAFGRNDFLGEVLVNMDSVNLDDYKPKWHKLDNKSQPAEGAVAYKGDLLVSLMYSDMSIAEVEEDPKKKKKKDKSRKLSGRGTKSTDGNGILYVKIKEATNLVGVRIGGTSNPFVKGYLEPDRSKSGKHKTTVLRGTCNPVWNHVMKFDNINLTVLKERCLELTVWDHETLSSNEFLGGTRLNLGTGEFQKKPASWNDATSEEIEVWEEMLKSPGKWVDASIVLRPSMISRLQFS